MIIIKSEVLNLLKSKSPGYVSGEEISQLLGVSRTAIWKQINSLREDGYIIDSQSRMGYRLCSVPDFLYPEEIQEVLQTRLIGNGIVHFQLTASTNNVAKELAAAGVPEGTVVIAEEQSNGRGRMGRAWNSPAGKGLWLSFILRPAINPMDAPKMTLLTAVALARTFLLYPGIKPGIKWPNDILIQGKKVAGVLTEMSAELDRINYIVIGVGVNINTNKSDLPPELLETATSLKMETNKDWVRRDFLKVLFGCFEELYTDFLAGNFAEIIEEWKRHSVTLNRQVRIIANGSELTGLAKGLDQEGALLVETSSGQMEKVIGGEVVLL